jgi:hypothetical protein
MPGFAQGANNMNFTTAVTLQQRVNFFCEQKQLGDTIGFLLKFCGGMTSKFGFFLPVAVWSARAPGAKPPCITNGVCIFGRYNGRQIVIGGGF